MTTTSNALYYENQYDQVSQATKELCDAYQESLESLDTQDCWTAMITIMTSTLIIVAAYQEVQMMNSVVTMDALSTLEADENSMQASFDDYEEDWNNMYDKQYDDWYNYFKEMGMSDDDAAAWADAYATEATNTLVPADKYVNSAYKYAQDIESICSLPEFESISGDVDTQIESLFEIDNQGNVDIEETADDWENAVNAGHNQVESEYDDGNLKIITDLGGDPDLMQNYTNVFSALSTDFENLSSSEESKLKYYEGEDQQMQGLEESLAQEWATELQTDVNNQIVA